MRPNDIERIVRKKLTQTAGKIGALLVRELKVVLSVPAPRVPGSSPPRAATKATPGAPPRKLSGRGRAAVVYRVEPTADGVTLYVGNNVIYMRVHEQGNHKWLLKTIRRMMPTVMQKFRDEMGAR